MSLIALVGCQLDYPCYLDLCFDHLYFPIQTTEKYYTSLIAHENKNNRELLIAGRWHLPLRRWVPTVCLSLSSSSSNLSSFSFTILTKRSKTSPQSSSWSERGKHSWSGLKLEGKKTGSLGRQPRPLNPRLSRARPSYLGQQLVFNNFTLQVHHASPPCKFISQVKSRARPSYLGQLVFNNFTLLVHHASSPTKLNPRFLCTRPWPEKKLNTSHTRHGFI